MSEHVCAKATPDAAADGQAVIRRLHGFGQRPEVIPHLPIALDY